MDKSFINFLENCDSRSIRRLVILNDTIKNLPPEKMERVSKINVHWTFDPGGEGYPELSLEFFR